MEEPVVSHPVHLGLLLVVLVPHFGLHVFAGQEKEIVDLFNGLEGFLESGSEQDSVNDHICSQCLDTDCVCVCVCVCVCACV